MMATATLTSPDPLATYTAQRAGLGANQFIFLLSVRLGVCLPVQQAITMEIIPVPENPS